MTSIDYPLLSLIQSGVGSVVVNDNAAPASNVLYSSLKTVSASIQSPYVVSPNANQGTYTTIQAAMNAASTAGGGVVYVKPGVYTENLLFATGVHLVGTDDGVNSNGNTSLYGPVIVGVHTFPADTCSVALTGLIFGNINSTSTDPIFTMAPTTSAVTAVVVSNCVISDQLNKGSSPSACFYCNSAGGTVALTITRSTLLYNTMAIVVGASTICELSYSTINTFIPSGPCITLTSAGSTLASSFNSLGGSIRFTGPGTVTSVFDNYNAGDASGHCVNATGAFGSFSFGDIIASGTATTIDPQVTKTAFVAVS